MTAGYSRRSLVQKLGIKEGTHVIVIGAPPNYQSLLKPLPSGAAVDATLPASCDFIHAFARGRAELARGFTRLAGALTDDGTLWISWPKRSGGVATDLDENVVRQLGLAEGLVDVKVCAIDETWSGLKFVRRLVNRATRSK
jgi:hypothetical protein